MQAANLKTIQSLPIPTDAALPALRLLVQQRELVLLLSSFLSQWTDAEAHISECCASVRRYVPGKRCIVALEVSIKSPRIGGVERKRLIAKAYAIGQGREAYERLCDLENCGFAEGTLTVTKPLAYVAESQLLLLHYSNGESLRNLILTRPNLESYMELAAQWLVKLHLSGIAGGRRYTLQRHLFTLAQRKRDLEQVAPELARQFGNVLALVERQSGEPDTQVLRPTHRDFSPDHLLVDGPHLTGLDFDEFCQYDSLFDVAHFMAHVYYLGLLRSGSFLHFASLTQRFATAYETYIRNPLPARLELYLALSCLKLAQIAALVTRPPHWQQITHTLLAQAQQFAKED